MTKELKEFWTVVTVIFVAQVKAKNKKEAVNEAHSIADEMTDTKETILLMSQNETIREGIVDKATLEVLKLEVLKDNLWWRDDI